MSHPGCTASGNQNHVGGSVHMYWRIFAVVVIVVVLVDFLSRIS